MSSRMLVMAYIGYTSNHCLLESGGHLVTSVFLCRYRVCPFSININYLRLRYVVFIIYIPLIFNMYFILFRRLIVQRIVSIRLIVCYEGQIINRIKLQYRAPRLMIKLAQFLIFSRLLLYIQPQGRTVRFLSKIGTKFHFKYRLKKTGAYRYTVQARLT